MPTVDRVKIASEIKGMQLEIKNLQNALAELVDAMITEEKPGPREIKKLEALKKKAQNGNNLQIDVKTKIVKIKSKRKKNDEQTQRSEQATFDK
jgi:hypothetical protein